MAHYALSDVTAILGEREWQSWDELLEWVEGQTPNAQEGLAQADKDDLIRDLTAARDAGAEFTTSPGELYRTLHAA